MKEPGFNASESTALMTMIPISAVGQEENLWLILRLEEDRSIMNYNSCHIQRGHLRVDSDDKSMSADRLGGSERCLVKNLDCTHCFASASGPKIDGGLPSEVPGSYSWVRLRPAKALRSIQRDLHLNLTKAAIGIFLSTAEFWSATLSAIMSL